MQNNDWLINKNGVFIKFIFCPIPEGTPANFFDENKSIQKILKCI